MHEKLGSRHFYPFENRTSQQIALSSQELAHSDLFFRSQDTCPYHCNMHETLQVEFLVPTKLHTMTFAPFTLERYNYALYGALFGICFPVIASIIHMYELGGISSENFGQSQSTPLLWIIDTAPLFLGLFAYFGGLQMDRVKNQNQKLEKLYHATQELSEKEREANRAKSEFLAHMSHEIRTPMNAIIGLTYLLQKTTLSEKQLQHIQKIDGASQNLLRVINDILDFSKIEAGKLDVETTDFSLDEMVNGISDLANVKLKQKPGVELIFDIDRNLPNRLVGDPVRLKQILLNLIDNSIKFTDKGEVKLSLSTLSETDEKINIRFLVSDTGIGIEQEKLKSLFSPFIQADASTTRIYGGTGLGLTICKRLIDMMGGTITVDSTPGEGTTFTIEMSLDKSAKSSKKRLLEQQGAKLKALVVDDLESARMVMCEMLESFGFATECAKDGYTALSAISNSIELNDPFSIVIMDWKMPGMNGVETINKMKQTFKSNVPMVVMATAYGMDEAKISAAKGDIGAYLVKPVNSSILYDTLNTLLIGKQDHENVGAPSLPADSDAALTSIKKTLGGSHILLVEDNQVNMEIATDLLMDVNVKVTAASNGQEALEMLEHSMFDAVLMDIQMPVMDGLTATQQIRKQPELEKLPVIAMTAHALKGEYEKSMEVGMNEHITKPVNPMQLYRTLEKYVSGKSGKSNVEHVASTLEYDVPLISGIDREQGLSNVRNKKKTYHKALIVYADQYDPFPFELFEHLKKENWQSLYAGVHSIKGASSIIGAKEIVLQCVDIEFMLNEIILEKAIPDSISISDQLASLKSKVDGIVEQLKSKLTKD